MRSWRLSSDLQETRVCKSSSEEREQEVVNSMDLDNWDQAGVVAVASEDFLSPDDHAAFQMIMGKVMDLLARLVKDETVHISKSKKLNGKYSLSCPKDSLQATDSTIDTCT